MDTVSRLFAKYVAPVVVPGAHAHDHHALAAAAAAASPASSHELHPRRLSFALSSPSTAAADAHAAAASTSSKERGPSRFFQRATTVALQTLTGKRAREDGDAAGAKARTAASGANTTPTGGGKRARSALARDVGAFEHRTTHDAVERGDDAAGMSWPSVKRKRGGARGAEDDDALDDDDAPAAHKRKLTVSDDVALGLRVSAVHANMRITPALVVTKVLKGGRLDGERLLPAPTSSRVAAKAIKAKRGPSRRGLPRRPRSSMIDRVALTASEGAEFVELPEDRAEREKAEALKAPALSLGASAPTSSTTSAGTFTFGAPSDAKKPLAIGAPSSAATVAAITTTTTTTTTSSSGAGGSIFGAAAKPSSTFTFSAPTPTPTASTGTGAIPNPFASTTAAATTTTTTATPNPFSAPPPSGGFSFGAAPAPQGERRVVRARRPSRR
jgi:hypothetical protein